MTLFSLSGKVIHGNHLGRTLGYPTANLDLVQDEVPAGSSGVYAARVRFEGNTFTGMANIGYRPTIRKNGFTVEVHLFGYTGDLYGKTLVVEFTERIRDEVKFGSLEALTAQMRRDELRAKEILSELL